VVIILAMVGEGYANGSFEALLLVSWPAVALFVASTAFVILLLFHFLKKERYKRSPRPEKGVEFVTAQRAIEAQTLALTPKVISGRMARMGYFERRSTPEDRGVAPGRLFRRVLGEVNWFRRRSDSSRAIACAAGFVHNIW
jgi:hypothetical protein